MTANPPNPEKAPRTISERPLFGMALRLAAMAVLGIMFTFVKLAAANGVHVVESLFWRQLAGLPVVILWLRANGAIAGIRTANIAGHAIRMILGVSAMGLNFLAITLLPMAQATTIGFATPIFATMLAALLLREPTGLYRWSAIIAGFSGVIIAMGFGHGGASGLTPGGDAISTGAIISLTGAIVTAGVAIQLRRMAQTETTGAIIFWFSLLSLVPLGMALPFFIGSHDGTTWGYIIALSILGAIAQILLTAALRYGSVATILMMDYSGLIWSLLFGFMIFGNIPGAGIWLGAPIIIGAGLFILWRENQLKIKAAERPSSG